MEVLYEIMDKTLDLLLVYGEIIVDFLSPYSVEIVIGLLLATFFFGFVQSYR